MRRRDFIRLFGGSAAAWPLLARAQTAIPVIGYLSARSPEDTVQVLEAFLKGLGDGGFVNGQNVHIEYRWARGDYGHLPALATELVQNRVTVLVATGGDASARAAKQATANIPVVFNTGSDPVKAGLVQSLNRPGGNVTGATFMGVELVAKRVELMHETVPRATRIALLVNPNNPGLMHDNIRLSKAAVQRAGLEMVVVEAEDESEIERAVASAAQQQAHALSIGNDAYLSSRSRQIATFALGHALPTMSESRDGVAAGLLMSYGPNQAETFRQAGLYIGRILKGESPADLPVIQPTEIERFSSI